MDYFYSKEFKIISKFKVDIKSSILNLCETKSFCNNHPRTSVSKQFSPIKSLFTYKSFFILIT